MANHALVRFVGSSQSDQSSSPDIVSTEFGMFFLALRAHQQKEHRLSGEFLVWCDEPLEEIILSGVWVIMQKIADLIGETLHTRAQAQLMVERVDRLINGGILLVYDTPEAATQAFVQKVILPVRRAGMLGYVPGMSVSVLGWKALLQGEESLFKTFLPKFHDYSKTGSILTHWQGPCALFFSELIKAARDYRKCLSAELNRLKSLNRLATSHSCDFVYVGAGYETELAEDAIYFLNEERSVSIPLPENTSETLRMLREAVARCHVFRSFRVNLSDWNSRFLSPIILENEWLNTQILLAQIQAPIQQEFLDGTREYVIAVSVLNTGEVSELIVRAFDRLAVRLHTPLDESGKQILLEKIERRIEVFRTWDPDVLNGTAMGSLLIRISETDAVLDSSKAFEIASGENALLFHQMCRSELDLQHVFMNIALSIVWPLLSAEELMAIVRARILPLDIFLDGLRQCRLEFQKEVVQAILFEGELHEASLQWLIDSNLIEINYFFFMTYIERLPPLFLGEHLFVLLQNAVTEFHDSDVVIFWRALGRAPKDLAQRFVNDERHRKELCQIVYEVLVSTDSKINWSSCDDVRLNLGEPLYQKLILGAVACARENMREGEEETEKMSSWQSIFMLGSCIFVNPRALGADISEIQISILLQKIPESRARTWAKLQ